MLCYFIFYILFVITLVYEVINLNNNIH